MVLYFTIQLNLELNWNDYENRQIQSILKQIQTMSHLLNSQMKIIGLASHYPTTQENEAWFITNYLIEIEYKVK